MRIAVIAFCAIGLAGCATPIVDESHLTGAIATLDAATATCRAMVTNHNYRTAHDWMACEIAAHATFATEIKLRDQAIIQAYTIRGGLLAGQLDSRQIAADEFAKGFQRLNRDFVDAIVSEIQQERDRSARNMAALAAFSQALQSASRSEQPPPSTTTNTTCTKMGMFVNCNSTTQ
jgi:hypothetical protein